LGVFKQLPAHFPGAHELGQQTKVLRFVPDAAGDDRWMNFKALGQLHHGERRRVLPHLASVPDIGRNEPVLGPLIGFIFLRIAPNALDTAQA
jgi:hypothetical protein